MPIRRAPFGRLRTPPFESLRAPIAVGVAAAATLGIALLLAAASGAPGAIAVTGVANVFLASRAMTDLRPARRFAELPVLAVLIVVAGAFGVLLVALPPVGAVLLALAVAASVWARRLGPRGRRIGPIAAAPFVSVLIVPAPAIAAGPRAALLVPLVAILGQVVTAVVLTALRVHGTEAPPQPARRAAAGRRLDASTRQAVQILLALLLAFAVGFIAFGPHWAWVVITVYVVQIGARGRGDAALKAVERLGGAVGGTVVGMLVAAIPLPDPVRVALILVVLVVAVGLRPRSYVWWAAGITTALALLFDVLGIGSTADLLPRVAAVVVGGAIAVAVAWFVLPIRSRDVLRRWVADHLAEIQGALRALREGEAPSAPVSRLALLAGTHRAQARLARLLRREPPSGLAVLEAMARVDAEVAALLGEPPGRGLGVLERQVGALRRLTGRRDDAERAPASALPLSAALDALWDPLDRLR